MSVSEFREKLTSDSFVTAASTVASYTVILVLMFVVLFVVPYLLFQFVL
jgi:hypothetical protein